VGLGVAIDANGRVSAAGGFLVQTLPGASEEAVARMEQNVVNLPSTTSLLQDGVDAGGLADLLLAGLGGSERHYSKPEFFCPCTRERALRTLALLGPEEIGEIVESDSSQEVRCEFCGRAYDISPAEMSTLLDATDA
jgi:molecular chaperone Hsp33